jgi:hypothetical protein
MNTKILMSVSSIFMFSAGVIFSFFPQEVLKMAGETASPLVVLILQLIGALYLGFALLNRMAKGNLLGGIYNRPIAIGNFTHFLVAGLALLKGASGFENPYIWVLAAVYAGFALAFGLVAFTHPAAVKTQD